MASAWGDSWGDAWGDSWGTRSVVKTGTGGIDPGEGAKRVPFKPTGLLDRPVRKEGRKDVADRVDESRQIEAEIAGKLAREFGDESQRIEEVNEAQSIVEMSNAEVDREIGILLRKKLRTEEDELMLVLLMAAAA